MSQDSNESMLCDQCGKPALIIYANHPLCVEHHLMMQQATYLQVSLLIPILNDTNAQIEASTGMPQPRMYLPRPPFVGDKLTLNNINVHGSNVGAINSGTIQNLDATITLKQARGDKEMAEAIKELTQAIFDGKQIDDATKNELAQSLEYLVAQTEAKPEQRSLGVIKGAISFMRNTISTAAELVGIWEKAEPIIRHALGL
ncbi:MAG: hypothetical protein V1724_01580 [Chloroflexota bacterium]